MKKPAAASLFVLTAVGGALLGLAVALAVTVGLFVLAMAAVVLIGATVLAAVPAAVAHKALRSNDTPQLRSGDEDERTIDIDATVE